MKWLRALAALMLAGAATAAAAGPPYLTDDPVPTDLSHWEIYAFTAGVTRHSDLDDSTGLDLNYGGFKDVQLTATVPIGLTHDAANQWRAGSGDLELAVKYRFLHDEKHGVSVAVFPRVILPTSTIEPGEKTRVLLPVWAEKDFKDGTSLFGGGGFELNPGAGNRNFWQLGLAATRDITDQLSVGGELTRQSRDTAAGTGETDAGLGAILRLTEHDALLVSAGPSWADRHTSLHFYAALGFDF